MLAANEVSLKLSQLKSMEKENLKITYWPTKFSFLFYTINPVYGKAAF